MQVEVGQQDAAQAGGELQGQLLQARSLIDSVIEQHHRQTRVGALTVLPDDDAVQSATEKIIGAARRELICIAPPGRCPAAKFDAIAGVLSESVPKKSPDDVSIRFLCTPELAKYRHEVHRIQSYDWRVDIRVTRHFLYDLVIVDECTALVNPDGGPLEHSGVVLRTPSVVRTLHCLVASIWAHASPAASFLGLTEGGRRERDILRVLGSGLTDEAAARRLDMSVRSYRRYVAKIMLDLGAASRFQAGARAAALGLIAPFGDGGERGEEAASVV